MKHNICRSAMLTSLQAQNDLNVGFYTRFAGPILDSSVLDDVFDTVRVNGFVVTGGLPTKIAIKSYATF